MSFIALRAIKRAAGQEIPQVLFVKVVLLKYGSTSNPGQIEFIADNQSAHAASQAFAISQIFGTLADNFIVIGFEVFFLTKAVACSALLGSQDIGVHISQSTLGQDIFTSSISAGYVSKIAAISQKSSSLFQKKETINGALVLFLYSWYVFLALTTHSQDNQTAAIIQISFQRPITVGLWYPDLGTIFIDFEVAHQAQDWITSNIQTAFTHITQEAFTMGGEKSKPRNLVFKSIFKLV